MAKKIMTSRIVGHAYEIVLRVFRCHFIPIRSVRVILLELQILFFKLCNSTKGVLFLKMLGAALVDFKHFLGVEFAAANVTPVWLIVTSLCHHDSIVMIHSIKMNFRILICSKFDKT